MSKEERYTYRNSNEERYTYRNSNESAMKMPAGGRGVVFIQAELRLALDIRVYPSSRNVELSLGRLL